MAGVGEFFFGKPAETQRFDRFDQGQNQSLQQLLQYLVQLIGQPNNQQNQSMGMQNNQSMGMQNNQGNNLGNNPSWLQNFFQPGQSGSFEPIRENANRNFNEQTIPSILERFAGHGGSSNSSALQNSLLSGAQGLNSNLGALEAQYNLQNRGLNQQQQGMQFGALSNLLQQALQPKFENAYFARQPGLIENVLSGLGGGAAKALGYKAGNYLG